MLISIASNILDIAATNYAVVVLNARTTSTTLGNRSARLLDGAKIWVLEKMHAKLGSIPRPYLGSEVDRFLPIFWGRSTVGRVAVNHSMRVRFLPLEP